MKDANRKLVGSLLTKCILVTVVSFAGFQRSSGQQVTLKVEPSLAITDDRVSFTCSGPAPTDSAAVYYTLMLGTNNFAEVQYKCQENRILKKNCNLAGCNTDETTCDSLIIKDILAQRDTMQGDYYCKVEHFSQSHSIIQFPTSSHVRLTVGDKTPPISEFRILNKETSIEIANGTELAADTSINIRCETPKATPEPGFVVSISGRENRTNLTVGHAVEFDETLPREPIVTFRCEVFNGFGERQTKQIVLLATYPAIHSEMTIPTEIPIQTSDEVSICSARNNPSLPLRITDFDTALLQEGYPKYRETLGMSYAYVKLSDKAAEIKDAKLNFQCHASYMATPYKASVALVSTNSAMMTAGIVILAILAFVIIAAGIAYALKRRSAAPKPASDKVGYGRVNQNDAAVSAADSRRVLRSRLDELPSTVV